MCSVQGWRREPQSWDAPPEGPPCGPHFLGLLRQITQTKWVETPEMYSLMAPEAKVQNQGVCWTTLLPKPGRIGPCFFQLLVASSVPWLVIVSLRSRPLSSCGFSLWVSLSCLCGQISHEDPQAYWIWGPP